MFFRKSRFTPKQRLQIYELAEYMYRVNNPNNGLCYHIKSAAFLYHTYEDETIMRDFPELRRVRPLLKLSSIHYWWPLSDKGTRLKAFDKMIRITKKKIK